MFIPLVQAATAVTLHNAHHRTSAIPRKSLVRRFAEARATKKAPWCRSCRLIFELLAKSILWLSRFSLEWNCMIFELEHGQTMSKTTWKFKIQACSIKFWQIQVQLSYVGGHVCQVRGEMVMDNCSHCMEQCGKVSCSERNSLGELVHAWV